MLSLNASLSNPQVRAALEVAAIAVPSWLLMRQVLFPTIRWLHRGRPHVGELAISRLQRLGALATLTWALVPMAALVPPVVSKGIRYAAIISLVVFAIESLRTGVFDALMGSGGRRPVPAIFRDILFAGIYGLAALLFSGLVLHLDLTPVLTGSAILSVVFGLAMQDTLSQLFAGLAIHADSPFKIGDWITLEDVTGRVIEVTWRSTKIVTTRHQLHVIPNATISKGRIANHQGFTRHHAELVEFSVSYDDPPSQVRSVFDKVVRRIPDILDNPAPDLVIREFADSGVHYQAFLWIVDAGQARLIRGQFLELLWYHLRRSGLSIPYPTRTIHLVDQEKRREETVQEIEAVLRGIDLFACMDEGSIGWLAKTARTVHYKAGERIFTRHDIGDSLFVIRQGLVHLTIDPEQRRVTRPFAILEEGGLFGEMSLLTGEARTASADAATDCDLIEIDHHQLAPLLEEHPEFLQRISLVIADRQARIDAVQADHPDDVPLPGEFGNETAREVRSLEMFERIRKFFKLR